MATNDSSIISRQENEFEVLKSIFGNNFIDLRELEEQNLQQQQQQKRKSKLSSLNERRLPSFRISLFPLNSQSQSDERNVYVQIDLKVEFTPAYPNKYVTCLLN